MKVSSPIIASAEGRKPSSAQTVLAKPIWQRLWRVLSKNHVIGWGDQAVVSATSFLALVMIGRWTDPDQLGAYAIALSVLALLLATQESLITRPYAIQFHRPVGTSAEHAFNSLVLSFALSAVAMLLMAAMALVLSAFGAPHQFVAMSWALAGTIPFVLAREFARRFAFACLKMPRALLVDLAVAVLTIVALAGLAWGGRLSAITALAAIGAACGIATVGWLYLARSEFAVQLRQVPATLQQSWGLGKWFLSGQLALQAQGYATLWVTMATAGATVTGIYTACASIVGFANPLLYGFFNVLTPKSVRTLKMEGGSGLRRQAAYDAVWLGLVMAAFCLLVFLVGEDIMSLLYRGVEYSGNGHVLAVLAVAAGAGAIGVPASIALAAAERARPVAGFMIVTAAVNVVLVLALLPGWGLLGAAYGMLAAEVFGSLGRWIAFLLLVPGTEDLIEEHDLNLARSQEL